ncbi:hypothetical protein [Thermotomaculum hydrothermale]|uniref:hypothetical protein n=1 Tax=Thermotomaculum hydrothermale TaxID=981385 RepID=UPI001915A398|nr:hypothetical protein [Thermotomaculum hydrothermale]
MITVFILAIVFLILAFVFGFGIASLPENQAKRGLVSGITGIIIFVIIFYGYLFFWKGKYSLTETIIGVLFAVAIIISLLSGHLTGKKKQQN